MDDAPPASFLHLGNQGARKHHASAEIEFDDAVPVLIFHLVNWTRNVGSRVVHQNIHATHFLKRCLGQTLCVARASTGPQ